MALTLAVKNKKGADMNQITLILLALLVLIVIIVLAVNLKDNIGASNIKSLLDKAGSLV